MDADNLRKSQFHLEQLQLKGIPDRSLAPAVVLRFQGPGESPAGFA